MLEQAAIELVPGPVLTTALAALVVGRSSSPAAKRWSEMLADGALPCAVVLDESPVAATANASGGIELHGEGGYAWGGNSGEIGRAQVRNHVIKAHIVCPLW